MLVIRDAQMAVFARQAKGEFEDRMVSQIESGYPRHFARLGEAGARRFVQKAIAMGAANGISGEGSVAVLMELMLEFGEQFEMSPERAWARRMLAHPTLPGVVKVDVMRDRLTAATQGRTIVRFPESQS